MNAPKDLKEINMDYMKAYVMEQGEEDMRWLIDKIGTEVDATDKNGQPIRRRPSFMEVKYAFACKYFPEIAPSGRSKKFNKMNDTMKELQAALAAKEGQ